MTGDWTPIIAGAIGLAAVPLYMAAVGVIPRPQWSHVPSARAIQWSKAYGQSVVILILSVILLVTIITSWMSDNHSTIEQAPPTQMRPEQPVNEKSVGEKSVVEKPVTGIEKQELESEAASVTPDRIFTPRSPAELMDIAAHQTMRDAIRHKDSWINVEGTVLDISDVVSRRFDDERYDYIELKIEVDKVFNGTTPRVVNFYVRADIWRSQVDKIERGDWLNGAGTVYEIGKLRMYAIDGEIISVSGTNK